MSLPFSEFVNDLLSYLNRAPGQIHQCGWLNITIFQVSCKIAKVQAIVPLFGSLFSTKHRPFDTSLSEKGGGRLSKNFLAGPHPNKVHPKQFHGQWFLVWDPESPFLGQPKTAYCEESSLIMSGLIHDKMYDPRTNVWNAAQNATDPTKVEVAAMKGKRLPHFSSQLVIYKPLVPGSEPVPVFPTKRGSNLEASASVSKHAKLEALANTCAPILAPTTSPLEVISLVDELTLSAQKEVAKKKSGSAAVFVRPPKAIIPLLAKSGANAKKGKGNRAPAQGEGSSFDCYSA
ncbi:hypothetical protein LIER_22517 [Lithospermum erythrorhizon]|uniref:Uncharacterized protein n=1 Tax=Lithospermum erythrorhizon TaxID=34254 RepID=A0AAV3QXA3_LITER